jgi:hypothetical protein
MKYEANDIKTIIDGENTVSKVKENIIYFLNLNKEEKELILNIKNEKDLLKLVNNPENYFTVDNVKEFLKLKKEMDLLGGIYYA